MLEYCKDCKHGWIHVSQEPCKGCKYIFDKNIFTGYEPKEK